MSDELPFLPGDEWAPQQTKEERKASIVKAAKANHQIAFVMGSGSVAALAQLLSSAMVAGGLTRTQREFAANLHDDFQKRLIASLALADDPVGKEAASAIIDSAGLPVLLEGNEFHLEDFPHDPLKFTLKWTGANGRTRYAAHNTVWGLVQRATSVDLHLPAGIVAWLSNARAGSRAEWVDQANGTVKASVDAA